MIDDLTRLVDLALSNPGNYIYVVSKARDVAPVIKAVAGEHPDQVKQLSRDKIVFRSGGALRAVPINEPDRLRGLKITSVVINELAEMDKDALDLLKTMQRVTVNE